MTLLFSGGDKQLTDLFGQYLQKMLCPSLKSIIPIANDNYDSSCDHQVDADDWVVMSRVRCMCRLLVDCSSFTTPSAITNASSTSGSTTAANKGRVIKKGNSSSFVVPSVTRPSSDGLVQCWKSIVKQHLQEVLGSLLTDDKPHSLATGLVNVYTKLKCAMRELFGGHSRYAIALKEGFAEQLQALSESHSVQVKKLVCLLESSPLILYVVWLVLSVFLFLY